MEEPNESTISVVIPCYNGAQWIEETIQSALRQSVPVLEVIVVDDGSTDNSALLVSSIKDARIKLIQQANSGESVARNRGIQTAAGEWVGMLDADDLWVPEKLSRQLKHASDDVVAVASSVYCFGRYHADLTCDSSEPTDIDSRLKLMQLCGLCDQAPQTVGISHLLVRRDHAPEFPEWTGDGEDLLFLFDLLEKGRVVFVPEPLAGLRTHSNNQTRNPDMPLRHCNSVMQWLDRQDATFDAKEASMLRHKWRRRTAKFAIKELLAGNVGRYLRFCFGLGFSPRYIFQLAIAHIRATPALTTKVYRGVRMITGRWRRAVANRFRPNKTS